MQDFVYQAQVAHMWALYQSTLASANSGIALGIGVDSTLVNAVEQIRPRVVSWSEEGSALVNTDDATTIWYSKGQALARDLKNILADTPDKVIIDAAKETLIDASKQTTSMVMWIAGAAIVLGIAYIYFMRGKS